MSKQFHRMLWLYGILGVLMSPLVTQPAVAEPFVLTTEGEAQATLVVPADPLRVEQFAAEELRYHVSRATGVELPIVKESDAAGESMSAAVYIGATRAAADAGVNASELAANGFVVEREGDRLFIVGRDSDGPVGREAGTLHGNYTHVGTLFGIYEILETQLDIRWLWPGESGEVIPRRRTIELSDVDQLHEPELIHKRWRDYGRRGIRAWQDQEAGMRFFREQAIWLRRHRFAMAERLDVGHSFTDWWEKYGEDHPEYFNMLPDGTRRPDPLRYGGAPRLVSMCLSNPELPAAIVTEWMDGERRGHGQSHFLNAAENDGANRCVCSRCLNWDAPDSEADIPHDLRLTYAEEAFERGDPRWPNTLASVSDRFARYLLAVQEEARKVDPDVLVGGHAYSNYRKPPVQTQLNENVLLTYVPRLYFPFIQAGEIESRMQEWEGWSDTGAMLMLRPNMMLSGHNMPLIFAHQIGEFFEFAYRNGMLGTDYDALFGQFGVKGPNLYMTLNPCRRSTHIVVRWSRQPTSRILGDWNIWRGALGSGALKRC